MPIEAGASRPPARVLYVIGGLGRGGAERQLLELASRLDGRRFRAEVCALGAGHEFAAAFAERKVPVVELPRRGSFDPSRLLGLRRRIRGWRPALVHAYLPAPARYARLACAGLRERPAVVVSERMTGAPRTALQRWIDRRLDRLTDRYVANAGSVRDSLADLLGSASRIEVIPNGIDPAPLETAAPRTATRRKLGWSEEEAIVFSACRLHPDKDLPTLLAAMGRIAAGRRLRLVVAGEGPLRAELERAAANSAFPVDLLGLRDDVPDLMRAADLLALSSRTEGFPNVVAEAMLAGLPVVATAVGGVPEVVRDGIEARLVPPGDADALARAIAELVDAPVRARRLGAAGALRARENFSVEAMVERTQTLYECLLAERSA